MYLRAAVSIVLAIVLFLPGLSSATVVRMEIGPGSPPNSAPPPILGFIDIELYDDEAPKTVANFLRYAARGSYNNVFIHVGVPGFAIQGGGYFSNLFGQPQHIATDPPVPNEFSPLRSNVRGTIAMAKLPETDNLGNPIPGGGPDSAASEWFINIANNGGDPYRLDSANGGYTVFGRVLDNSGTGNGMALVDMIANLPHPDPNDPNMQGLPFPDLPLLNYNPAAGPDPGNLVTIIRIPNVAATPVPSGGPAIITANADMTFNYFGPVDTSTAVSLLEKFTAPPNTSANFNNSMFIVVVSGTMGAIGRSLTLYDHAATRPNHYYAYGQTSDNTTEHWYDFTFDGETGAEIKNDRIILHFIDGKRGDNDLSENGVIEHIGAQAVVTPVASSQTAGGCSIASAPTGSILTGDWALVTIFLIALGIVRKRTFRS